MVQLKQTTDHIIDAPATSYTISGILMTLGLTLDNISAVLNIVLALIGITIGYYRIRYERRKAKKLDSE